MDQSGPLPEPWRIDLFAHNKRRVRPRIHTWSIRKQPTHCIVTSALRFLHSTRLNYTPIMLKTHPKPLLLPLLQNRPVPIQLVDLISRVGEYMSGLDRGTGKGRNDFARKGFPRCMRQVQEWDLEFVERGLLRRRLAMGFRETRQAKCGIITLIDRRFRSMKSIRRGERSWDW